MSLCELHSATKFYNDLELLLLITEYDTLGSESDNDVTSRAVNQAKYRQRGIYENQF